ncbi:MAG: amidohydrolase family protein [Alphaproteobacteria bacterium]|nr:amidohydrolase family protein [Alphaproteobacteria bacterium]
MLFKCLPQGAPIPAVFPGRFPGPAHARGKWFTIDIHCHVLNEQAAAMVSDERAAAAIEQPRTRFANERTREVNRQQAERTRIQFTSVETRLADMDQMGIDIQAISPSPIQTYYGLDPDLGIATARLVNDNIADICGRHPDRFVGLGTVPFQAPDLAVAELDRLHKSLGLRGIEMATNVAGADLSQPHFRKIFARIEELGLTIFMHPTGFPEARRFADHYFTNLIGNPLDSTVAVHHLIFGGALHDHPNLKLVVAHGGGYLPAYSGRIDHGAAARPDCCENLRHMPTTYLSRLFFDTIVFTHHQLEYLVRQFGADHVLMGTDYPADMGEVDPIGFIEGASGLDDVERRAILGHNAARLLAIEIPAHAKPASPG